MSARTPQPQTATQILLKSSSNKLTFSLFQTLM